jgi:copper transport protein
VLVRGQASKRKEKTIRSPSGGRAARVALVAATLAVALVAAPAALAHAILLQTRPLNGAIVKSAPAFVTLHFSEPVETAFGSVRVYDADARRVDAGQTTRPAADTVRVGLPTGLARGTYTVAWRAISADTHPVHGAFTFSVGSVEPGAAGVAARVLAGERTPEGVTVVFWVVRFLSLLLVLLLAGGALSLVVCLRDGSEQLRRRLALTLAVAAALLVPACLVGIVLEGAEAGGYSVWAAAHGDVVWAVLDTRFGQAWLARAALAAVVAAVAVCASRRPGSRSLAGLAVVASCLVPTLSVASHAGVAGAGELAADLAHAAAAAAWVGGLAVVCLALVLTPVESRWQLGRRVVPRFSTLALGSVAALLAAGIVNGYLEVRAWRGLWATTYGVLLLAKVGILVGLVALGALNRLRSVPRLQAGTASTIDRRLFVRTISTELAIMVVAVGVTAALVAEPPARAQVAASGPFASTSHIGPFELNLVVDPARTGRNQIHLYLLDRSGRPAAVAEAKVSTAYPAADIGPFRLRPRRAGPGHYVVPAAQLPIAGDWRIGVTVRRGEFDEWTQTMTSRIRKDG